MQKVRLFLLNTFLPVTQEIGKIHAPYSVKDMDEEDVYEAMKRMAPGMVFLTRTEGQLGNALIPGFWSHCAIVTGDHHVTEAIGEGVTRTGIFNFLMRKDYAVLLRPVFASETEMRLAAEYADEQVGAKYDYSFLPPGADEDLAVTPVKDRAFYCAKLPWAGYRHACGPKVAFTTRQTLGVETVVPDDYDRAKDKWMRVWASPTTLTYLASK